MSGAAKGGAAKGGAAKGGPLHVAFAAGLSAALREEAAKRGLAPQVMVAAAMAKAVTGDLLDAIFDGDDPHLAAGGQGRRANGMTMIQCAVLHLAALHAGPDHVCHLSSHSYAHLLGPLAGVTQQRVWATLARLQALRLLAKVEKRYAGGVQPWRVTAHGLAVAEELGQGGWVPA